MMNRSKIRPPLRDHIPDYDFCVVDLETTGFKPEEGAEIIEMGGVRIEDGELTETFEQLVEPRRSIPPQITDITGITNEMVRGSPSSGEVLPKFVDFMGDAILIAHNFSFDFSFLDWYHNDYFFNEFICTVRMSRAVGEFRSNALDYLVNELELGRNRAHRALDDAVATGKLFKILVDYVTHPKDYHRADLPRCLREIDPGALAMDVSGIGEKKAEMIANHFNSLDELLKATVKQLSEIPGIGPGQAKNLRTYLDDFTPSEPVRDKPLQL